MNTYEIGRLTEVAVACALTKLGGLVSIPLGDGGRYDLIWDDGVDLHRVECKTGRRIKHYLQAKAFTKNSTGRHTYEGLADLFGVYDPETGNVYLVPVEEVGGFTIYLRLADRKNKGFNGKLARDYLI